MTAFDTPSAYDLSYLTRESEVQPLHFVVQLEVDGEVPVERVRQHVAERLAAAPVMLRTLRAPLGGGPPVWVDDPRFAIERHVVAASEADAADPVGALVRLTTERLPRDRPLWRTVVAAAAGRTHLWLCVQHAMMDGGLLAATLPALFGDAAPTQGWTPRRPPSRLELTARHVRRRLRRRAPRPSSVLRSPGPVSAQRALASTAVPLESLQPLRRATGATVNDVFLVAVAAGLRAYLEPPRDVLALIPVNVRRAEESTALGNRHRAMVVTLPVLTPSPIAALADVHAQVEAKKNAERTAGAERLGVEIVLTNTRTPDGLTLAGRPVVGFRFGLPLQESRLAVVAQSYEGCLTFDFTADAGVFPDVDRLARCTGRALDDLLAAARGLEPPG